MKDRKTIYWICQIIGWGLYTLFLIGMMALFGGDDDISQSTLILQFIVYLALVGSSHSFRLYIKRKKWLELQTKKLIPRAVLGLLIAALIAQTFIHLIIYYLIPLSGITAFSWGNFFAYVFNIYIVLILWASLYFSIKFLQRNRKTEVEKLELKAALQEAELMVLKNQINPHFLFNALNNIRSLILVEPDKARQMVTHISDLLRYSIQFNASEKVKLSEEIEIVRDYLELESIQFDERLSYAFEIDPQTEKLAIPPMAIQLLVENAIKHGLSTRKEGGKILIKASRQEKQLIIEVLNSGQLTQTSRREGIGLNNLVERMKILFGSFAEFRLENMNPDQVRATLKIPIS